MTTWVEPIARWQLAQSKPLGDVAAVEPSDNPGSPALLGTVV